MCGIAGFFHFGSKSGAELEQSISQILTKLDHRGPDDRGTWRDDSAGLVLGQTRLSILDLSTEGHQPMVGERMVIAYNGEIYNYRELRQMLEKNGREFVSQTDTEVVLAAIESWGIEQALNRINGMFAFAAWDRQEKQLILARDRIGIKPLYYGRIKDTFYFSSELKALLTLPEVPFSVDEAAIQQYLLLGYIPAPAAAIESFNKLMPGSYVVITDKRSASLPQVRSYWTLDDKIEKTASEFTEQEALEKLNPLLRDAVNIRMVADVPLGAFLSGGIDSSLIVAMMQEQSSKPIKTFSIGFDDPEYNEAPYAKAIATHLQTDHTSVMFTEQDCLAALPSLTTLFDEPFSDPSQLPTLLVSQVAKKTVTVCLSGDGGDELFAGYGRYYFVEKLWHKLKLLPYPFRRILSSAALMIPAWMWDAFSGALDSLVRQYGRTGRLSDKIYKLASLLDARSYDELYKHLLGLGLMGRKTPLAFDPEAVEMLGQIPDSLAGVRRLMSYDKLGYLPDDILTKVDRTSMACSLEARVPLLDHRLVEFASSLPTALLMNKNLAPKNLLRSTLANSVPRELFERPKKGFGIPLAKWLRGDLKKTVEELIFNYPEFTGKFFDLEKLKQLWDEHSAGTRNWSTILWRVYVLNQWYDMNS